MKFHEAAPQMKPGDIFKTNNDEWGPFVAQEEDEKETDSGKKYVSFKCNGEDVFLCTRHFNLEGEIIRAEKKPMTAEEYASLTFDQRVENSEWSCCVADFIAGNKNGHLERDIVYKPLMDSIASMLDSEVLKTVRLENLRTNFERTKSKINQDEQC